MNLQISSLFKKIELGSKTISDLQSDLCALLSTYYAGDFKIGFSLPVQLDKPLSLYSYCNQSDAYELFDQKTFVDENANTVRFKFEPINAHSPLVSEVVIAAPSELSSDQLDEAKALSIAFVSSTLSNVRKSLRRSVVHSKVRSNDLGSFVYRLIHDEQIHKQLNCENISIFVRDYMEQILRLRGTSGELKNGHRQSEIKFHIDDLNKKIVKCHSETEYRFEQSAKHDLDLDGISHENYNNGVWARLYWPISLTSETRETLRQKPDRNNVGVIRVTNCRTSSGAHIPFLWTHALCLDFLCETLFVIVDAFAAADEASFKKDEAFHNSMSVVDTIIKNIENVSDSIYNPQRARNDLRPPRFELRPLPDNSHIPAERLLRLLRTAYASAKDIGFQIARANDEIPFDREGITEFLVRDVLVRAVELVPDMCTAHSADENPRLPSLKDMRITKTDSLPSPVLGSPEALVSVFANIFENSVKYRKPDKRVEISLELYETKDKVVVVVSDKGVGVADDEIEKISNRGWRGANARFSPRGSGLGLSWCDKVLKTCDATLQAKSIDIGLEVRVTLSKVT